MMEPRQVGKTARTPRRMGTRRLPGMAMGTAMAMATGTGMATGTAMAMATGTGTATDRDWRRTTKDTATTGMAWRLGCRQRFCG